MTYSTIGLLAFVFILISDVVIRINSFIGVSNGNTLLTLTLNILTTAGLILLASRFRWRDKMPWPALLVFQLMMAWNLFSLLRGGLNVQGYWAWKGLLLNYVFSIMVPMAIVAGLNYEMSVKTLRFILSLLFMFGFVFIPITLAYDTEMYARIVIAVSLFILFVPYLKWRWRVVIFAVAATSVAMDLSYRANVIRIMIPLSLLAPYFCRHLITKSVLNCIAGVALCLPLLLLYLGITGQFNIFRDGLTEALAFDHSVEAVERGMVLESSLDADTRTFLYQEVFYSMINRDSSFLIGEGGGAGYETVYFVTLTESGRTGTEVGFLNLVLYSGAVGVLLYATMLFATIYYAINRSNNTLCKMLGIFLAGHWVIFFIEDITKLDMNYYFIWFAMGLCLSHQFRALTDSEIRRFFLTVCNPPNRRRIRLLHGLPAGLKN